MKAHLLIAGAVALAASIQAQNALGFSAGANTSYTSRISANNIEADVLNHYDTRDYQDWMLDPTDPTGATMKFTSLRVIVQDEVGVTPDSFTVVGYTEDPLNAKYPDPVAPWFRTGAINLPASTLTTGVAWIYTVGLTVPPVAKGDAWIGVGLIPPPVGTTWPTDGLSTHCTAEGAAYDLAGAGIASMPVSSTSCWFPVAAGVPTGPATYPTARAQIWLELNAPVASGVPVTQTNQTTYTSSNPGGTNVKVPLGGTTNMFSGLNPDLYDVHASTPPRNDDIGFLVNDATLPNSLVVVLAAFGASPLGSQPLSMLMGSSAGPGTKGNVCIDFSSAAVFVGIADATGVYQMMLSFTPATRLVFQGLGGIDLWYQGFVVNPVVTNGIEAHATGCGIQHL
jgi:hypothetical protein